jgi:hypothetical protein
MTVCILNDAGETMHLLNKSEKFTCVRPTPWQAWDAAFDEIIELYVQEGEFRAVSFSNLLWRVLRHFMTQSVASDTVLDGNVFAAFYAIQNCVAERFARTPIEPEVSELVTTAITCVNLCFRSPTESVNVLVQTGADDDVLKVFTTHRFVSWYNENDLCENYAFNTALGFEEFEKDFIRQLSPEQKERIYPELKSVTLTRPAFTSSFF